MVKVGIIFGGKSVEHEVSLRSAQNILEAIDKSKYEPVVIYIDKSGKWLLDKLPGHVIKSLQENREDEISTEIAVIGKLNTNRLIDIEKGKDLGSIDVVFPVIHGTNGEDGSIQGLFQLANLPYVGADILGSAIGMDKDVTKRLLRGANIPVADFIVMHAAEAENADLDILKTKLGFPFFVKPSNLGSSVGVSKVSTDDQFRPALLEAFKFSNKVLIEKNIVGRELECSVIGNWGSYKASLPGEVIIENDDFYSYQAKYIDESGATICIPAKLPNEIIDRIRELSVKVCETLCCEGMARVDFFLSENNELIVNEINTIPGFTNISMYSKLWEISGIPYAKVIDELIQLALDRHEKNNLSFSKF
jgi:D-alanine-D-alanine ligase